MKNILFSLFLILAPAALFGQNTSAIDGTWEGSIILQNQPLLISVTFNTMDGETDGSINIPQQSAFNLPVSVSVLTPDSLEFSFETGTGTAAFRASLNSPEPDEIAGIFTQSGVELPFEIIRSEDDVTQSDYFSEENIYIEADSLTIAGTLVVPDSLESEALVIFISGSGSQTRNSSVAGFELFAELADQLAFRGISSFRYDDRGTGESTGNSIATLSDLAGDLRAIANHFSETDDTSSFEDIVYLGHSQGGLVSLLAAEDFTPARLVLLATPMMTGDKVILQQMRDISIEQGISDEILEQNIAFQKRIFEAVRTGEGWDSLETNIEERLRAQLSQLPEEQRSTLGNMDQFIQTQVSRQLEGPKSVWFKSFIETDPRPYLLSLEVPTLVVFGENDSQVKLAPNLKELEQIERDFTVATIPNANHLFQVSESGMPGEYGILDKEFAPGLIDEIAVFLTRVESSP